MLGEYPFWMVLILRLRTIVLLHSQKQREGGRKSQAYANCTDAYEAMHDKGMKIAVGVGGWGCGLAVCGVAVGRWAHVYNDRARARCMWCANVQVYGRNNGVVTASRNPKIFRTRRKKQLHSRVRNV